MELLCLVLCSLLYAESVFGNGVQMGPGHLKPFGDGGPSQQVTEIGYFPTARDFFENYVKPSIPVIMRGAAKMSSAFGKWTDDYFLEQDEPSDNIIKVETKKKESRQQRVDNMSFKAFLKIYNITEHYMVDSVPAYLRHDIMIPCPLQCRQLADNEFVEDVMWYSSGGTKSVVHTDSVENINCLYRGEKTLVFVDPTLYADKVDIDRPEGSYSSMDVDSVDYTKFPGMADVKFFHVNMSAGDCLYIPYLWIHQVRSYGSNVAVNIWWKHHLSAEIDYDTCSDPCNPQMTLLDAQFHGFEGLIRDSEEIRNHFQLLVRVTKEMDMKKFTIGLIGRDNLAFLEIEEIQKGLAEMFSMLDIDKDAVVTKAEIDSASDEVILDIGDIMSGIEEVMYDQEIDIDEEEGGGSHPYDGDSDEVDLHNEL